jgi:hypothetical protein
MANTAKNKKEEKNTKHQGLKPDPETLHTTDPQEHMKGLFLQLCKTLKKKPIKMIRFQKKKQTEKEMNTYDDRINLNDQIKLGITVSLIAL